MEKINIKDADSVNHPSHYTDGKIEVIDYIDDKKLSYCLGNAVKYVSRAGKKDPNKTIEDLQKAVWYINHQIKLLNEIKDDKIHTETIINDVIHDLKYRLVEKSISFLSICLIEEMSELTKVLTKQLRNSEKYKIENLEEELGHVMLMCEVIQRKFNIDQSKIDSHQLNVLIRSIV